MLDQLIQIQPNIEKIGFNIAAVTQGKPGEALLFCKQRAPGIHCLADPERGAYRAYGLPRTTLAKILLNPKTYIGGIRARLRGHSVELPPPGQDGPQLPGLFAIGLDGRFTFTYYYQIPSDHPRFDRLATSLQPSR